ncbi:MAG: ribosomal L7Ae/L30e/S12e/Gadd45 family protein [Candidatus Aenigmatarchaeota archaeon]|nr:ribosomal L7Ae/L30e/S12e/Gadd45 family protein [Candidatus Aenigmarchaeota archaeon]
MSLEEKIKKALETKTLVIGSRSVLKGIKNGKIEYVIYAKNCPDKIKNDLIRNAKLSNIQVEEFQGTGKQLGIFVAKPFAIAVLGIKKM